MTTLVLCPADPAPAVELAASPGRWRKRLLPVGDVSYKGRTLHFTRDYITQLAQAFSNRAYDQVPFQLADSQNAHTNDPERYRGDIVSMDSQPDGLYVTLAPTEEGAKILQTNPRLGVSARIVEDYSRSDGKYFPAAIQHVLGTLDPRVPGLGGWEQVELANNPGVTAIYDLSGYDWSGIDISPAEIAAVDQASAEVEEEILQGWRNIVQDAEETWSQRAGDALAQWAATADLDDIIAQATEEQMGNSGDYGLSGDEQQEVLDIAYEMSQLMAEEGNYAEAAAISQELGFDAIELAGGMATVTELGNASFERESIRLSQDREAQESAALPGWRAPSAEQRLASAYERIAGGTYAPAGEYRRGLDLASPSGAGSTLARHRWASHQADPMAGITGMYPCGTADEFGRCAEPYHSADCGSLATTEIAQVLQDGGAYDRLAAMPLADANGRTWDGQDGAAMTMTDHIEAATGQRLGRASLFESGHGPRDLAAPQRQARYGDPMDPDDPGMDLPDVSALTGQLGLGGRDAGRERERAAADPRALAAALKRGITPDAQWDMSGRRAQVRERQSQARELYDDAGNLIGLSNG